MRKCLKPVVCVILAAISSWMSADAESNKPCIRIDFANRSNEGKTVTGFVYRGKLGTPGASYKVVSMDGVKVLRLESVQGTGTLLFDISKIDLQKYPIMRWKWRVDRLPDGADGREAAKDDQPIGIYVGYGGLLSQTSVAFRWEGDTPKDATGSAQYGMGAVSVRWKCVRNKNDKLETWYVDECDVYKALTATGKITGKVVLTLSINSQYTKSSSLSYIEYVEFLPHSLQTAEIKQKKE